MKKKSIRKKMKDGAMQGWHLLDDTKEIAIAGLSTLPTNATDWALIVERKLVLVQEYQGMLILCNASVKLFWP